MFSFGLFSTHLPFIVIGIVSFISMAYAYLNPLAFSEKIDQNITSLEIEVTDDKIDSSIDFYIADDQFHADVNHKTNPFTFLHELTSDFLTKPDPPPFSEYHSIPFFARPPPLFL